MMGRGKAKNDESNKAEGDDAHNHGHGEEEEEARLRFITKENLKTPKQEWKLGEEREESIFFFLFSQKNLWFICFLLSFDDKFGKKFIV
jgi:hypothetical protein